MSSTLQYKLDSTRRLLEKAKGVKSEHDAIAGASALRKRVVSLVEAANHLKARNP